MIDGDMDAGAWSCGMVVGLIHDIPTVKELIDRIMADAEASIIRQRLTGFLDGAVSRHEPARWRNRFTAIIRQIRLDPTPTSPSLAG